MIRRTLPFALAATLASASPAIAQAVEDVQVTLNVQVALPDASITGLDDLSISYAGDSAPTGVPTDQFCIYSPTQAFNLTLEGQNDAGGTFMLAPQAGSTSSIAYTIDIQDIINNTGSIGTFTPGTPVLVDIPDFAYETACDEFGSNAEIGIDFPMGAANSLDTVTSSELSDGQLYIYTDIVTLTLAPQI